MYSPQETFEKDFANLNQRWIELGSQVEQNPKLFTQLYKEILKTTVDVRNF